MRLTFNTAWWLGAFMAMALSCIVVALLPVENSWVAGAVVVFACATAGNVVGWLFARGQVR